MRKTIAFLSVALLGLGLLLGSCAAGKAAETMWAAAPGDADYAYAETTMVHTAMAEEWDALKEMAAGGETAPSQKRDALAGRKLIKDVSASVETRQFDQYLAAVEGKAAELGGYVENRETSDGGYYYTSMRNATLVLRVPADALDGFKGSLSDLGKVTSLNESVRDVTASYTDVATHIKALQTERDSLLKLMEQAKSLEDLLRVQDRLTDVCYRLDSLESQMRQMEDQIAMSAVTLHVYEVERVTPEQPQGFWGKTWANFRENLFSVGRGLRDFFSGLLSAIPYLVVIAVPVALVLWLLIRRRRKKRSK